MDHSPGYREFTPSPALAPFVECLWSWQAGGSTTVPDEIRVLPDGCVDLICDLSGPIAEVAIVGTMTRPLVVRPAGRLRFTAVRFPPGGAAAPSGRP